ncbi:glycosyltransferase [Dehalogenimonas sp. THU2]|uniref:glycosyltransferase n=1 Tax=Dehalogenimonas sp. THU2 TaxID=3151121 RepID=UPI003218C41A
MADKSLRIAMLSVHSCPIGQPGGRDTGGMNVYIRELAAALGRRGHSVDIYTRAHDPKDAEWERLAPGVRLIHIRAGAVEEMGKLTQYNHLREFCENLEDFRAQDGADYDLIHSHYWLSGEVGLKLAADWEIPHVFAFHTVGAAKDELGLGEPEPALRLVTEQDIVSGCCHILSGTEKERVSVIRHHECAGGKISVVPCGVDLDLFRPVDKTAARQKLGLSAAPTVLYVGRLDKLKGIDRLIRTMSLVKTPDCRLIVIGGDEYGRAALERLKQQAAVLGIDEKVQFIGAVPQRELPRYYSAADVVAVPSYSETFGMVALEAVACGVPVVSADVGAARLLIKEGFSGTVTPGNDPADMAEALEAWLNRDSIDRDALHASVRDFGWDAVAERAVSVYRKVLASRTIEVTRNG